MVGDDKDGGEGDFELDLDFDPYDEQATAPGKGVKRSRKITQSGGSQAPPQLEFDAPTVRPPDQDFTEFSLPRRSMIPGPGLEADDATSSRPTDPGPGRAETGASDKGEDTQKVRHTESSDSDKPVAEMTEAECIVRLGSMEQVPKVKVAEEEVYALGLDHRAGFLYSQIDGMTSLEDLVSISPMSREDTLRIFVQLLKHEAFVFA